MKENRILMLGAYDRYNYGDLLFPYVLEYFFEKSNTKQVLEYFGVVSSDLRAVGGKPTKSIRDFYKACSDNNYNNHVIIAGGECVAVKWGAYSKSLSKEFQLINKLFSKFSSEIHANPIIKRILGGRTDFVFSINKDGLNCVSNVFYNSLGASTILTLNKNSLVQLEKTLNKVDYLSVRDDKSRQNLNRLDIDASLYPDSAICMSDIFPVKVLERKVSTDVLDFVSRKQKFIFFQFNESIEKRYNSEIRTELEKINDNTDFEICFCPIGIARAHDDLIALKKMYSSLSFQPQFFEDVTIWDIMYLIANSSAYVGSSLHGAITAMSFEIPYYGLVVEKLDSYLKTWGISERQGITQINEVYNKICGVHRVNNAELKRSKEDQIKLYTQSVSNMLGLINL